MPPIQAHGPRSPLEQDLAWLLHKHKLPDALWNVTGLLPGRRFEVDAYWPRAQMVMECEGGLHHFRDPRTGKLVERGRHLRPGGYAEDVKKYNALTLAGFHLLRVTREMVDSEEAIDLVRAGLARWSRGGKGVAHGTA